MSHAHAHSHGETESTYFLDQLCTIAVSALLGFVAVSLYLPRANGQNWLQTKFLLNERFHVPVLIAGIGLIALSVLRGIAVWRLAGQVHPTAEDADGDDLEEKQVEHDHAHGHEHADAHDHGHAHDHAHGHGHGHGHEHSHSQGHEHSHGGGDGHDHGWAPWTYAVLIIPVVLFFLGLPPDGYNQFRLDRDLAEVALDSQKANQRIALANVAGSMVLPTFKKSDKVYRLRFSQLKIDASHPQAREALEGSTVVLEGFFKLSPTNDRKFQLFRVLVNCCGTDSITYNATVMAPEAVQGFQYMDWVEVEGELTFQQVIGGQDEWKPVIRVPSLDMIKRKPKPADPNKDV